MKEFSNHEIVTLAVYLLGGDTSFVDTEDIAVKANEIAPGRFTWRKHKDQINLEIIRVYLSDAKKPDKGSYLRGSGTHGWILTEEGLEFAQTRVLSLKGVDLSRRPTSLKERQWLHRERARMLASEAFCKFHDSRAKDVTRREAEAFFRIDEYVVGEQRERKLLRVINAFKEDPLLREAVKALASKVRGG